MKAEPLLRVAIRAGYPGKAVLKDVRFDLHPGEILGLVGTSGAGKSTVVLSLLGLLAWRGGKVEGEVLLDGSNLLAASNRELRTIRGRRIALIPQSPMSALNSALTLQAHFREAWKAHESASALERDARTAALLGEVQLPCDADFLRRRPSQISVGQAQRVLIALALLHRPQLIIADEPTSALDPVTQVQVLELLSSLNKKHGTTLLYISHDLLSVLKIADRLAVLDGGGIVEVLPVEQITEARHAATQALLGTLPAPPEVLLNFR